MKMTLTDPREFHLATNDRGFAYKAQLDQRERLEAQREKEARIVKATPVPDSSRAFHVHHSAKELTGGQFYPTAYSSPIPSSPAPSFTARTSPASSSPASLPLLLILSFFSQLTPDISLRSPPFSLSSTPSVPPYHSHF